MLVTYAEAASSKMCSLSDIARGVANQAIDGDDVLVLWNQRFHEWNPEVPAGRLVAYLNARRFDSRLMRVSRTGRPASEARDYALRTMKELGGYDATVVPVNDWNLGLLFRSCDGYFDGIPYNFDSAWEFEEMLNEGRHLYCLRTGLLATQYAGKNLYASELITLQALANLVGEGLRTELMAAIWMGHIASVPYGDTHIIIKNKKYDAWLDAMGTLLSPDDDSHGGTQQDEQFSLLG